MKRWCLAALLLCGLPSSAAAVDITVDGAGSTLVIHFNAGHTVERASAVAAAAQFWADYLISPVPVEIDIAFVSDLYCDNNVATLGAAGTTALFRDFDNAPAGNTWYPVALANALAGRDQDPGVADIDAEFNAKLDDPALEGSCLGGIDWYYGTGTAPVGTISFYQVVLHELGHGLGFQEFANLGGDGSRLMGFDDHFLRHLMDHSSGVMLSAMNDAGRKAAATDSGDLVWNGANVTEAAGFLRTGRRGGRVRMYAPNPYEPGNSTAHFDPVVTPDELMEPSITSTSHTVLVEALFRDVGWPIVNVPPVITGQQALAINEDTVLTVTLDHLQVSDPDSDYPQDFTLTVLAGANYTRDGATITPARDFNGTLTVPVRVSDGGADSEIFNLSVSVNPVNDPPVITGQMELATDEDVPLTLSPAHLVIEDPDTDDFTLIIMDGANYNVDGMAIVPANEFSGTLTVPVRVSDGSADSNVFDLTVTVRAVNDAPQFTSTPSVQAVTGQPYSYQAIAVDPDGSVTYGAGGLPAWLGIDPVTGLLSGTPPAGAESSHAITVTAGDGELTTAQSFTLSVVSPDSVDVTLAAGTAERVVDVGTTARVLFTLVNHGPAATASGRLDIALAQGGIVNHSADCGVQGSAYACNFSVAQAPATYFLDVTASEATTVSLTGNAVTDQTENAPADNRVSLGITFKEAATERHEPDVGDIGAAATRAVLVAELQGGAPPELVFANGDGQASEIYRFGTDLAGPVLHATLPDTADSYDVAAADVNGDGFADLIFANGGEQPNRVYANDGSGVFTGIAALGAEDSRGVAAGDLNGDGRVDLVFANAGGQANTVYLNDGNGGFALAGSLGADDSRSVAVTDTNGDGHADIVVANVGAADVIYVNRTAAGSATVDFSEMATFGGTESRSVQVRSADLDGDGVEDALLVARQGEPSVIYDLPDTGPPGALTGGAPAVIPMAELEAGDAVAIAAGDIDGDGLTDVSVLNVAGVIQVYLAAGTAFVPADVMVTTAGQMLVQHDLDADGRADTVVANGADHGNELFLTAPVGASTDIGSAATAGGGSGGGVIGLWDLLLLAVTAWLGARPVRRTGHRC